MYIRSACRSEFLDADDDVAALPEPVLLVEADHQVHPLLTPRLELEAGAVADIDGLALSELVRQLRPGTPVVFATGELSFLRRRRLEPGESFAPRAFLPEAVRKVARQRR